MRRVDVHTLNLKSEEQHQINRNRKKAKTYVQL
jgi:hypothetical protein